MNEESLKKAIASLVEAFERLDNAVSQLSDGAGIAYRGTWEEVGEAKHYIDSGEPKNEE